VGLGPVLHQVVAGRDRADAARADAARAVAGHPSGLAVATLLGGSAGAAAVDVGLRPILHHVVAGGSRTDAAGADAALAVAGHPAGLAVAALLGGTAGAAAVDVGLGPVLHRVVAGGSLTDAAGADAALAIAGHPASLAGGAFRGAGAAAVH